MNSAARKQLSGAFQPLRRRKAERCPAFNSRCTESAFRGNPAPEAEEVEFPETPKKGNANLRIGGRKQMLRICKEGNAPRFRILCPCAGRASGGTPSQAEGAPPEGPPWPDGITLQLASESEFDRISHVLARTMLRQPKHARNKFRGLLC